MKNPVLAILTALMLAPLAAFSAADTPAATGKPPSDAVIVKPA